MKIAAVRGAMKAKAGANGAFIRIMQELRGRGTGLTCTCSRALTGSGMNSQVISAWRWRLTLQ